MTAHRGVILVSGRYRISDCFRYNTTFLDEANISRQVLKSLSVNISTYGY